MNLVAISGLPPRPRQGELPIGEVEEAQDREEMWVGIAAFGVGVMIGYFFGKRWV